jgi:alanine racemase
MLIISKVAIGDKAILWGDKKLRVETVAHHSGAIGYELLTGVSARVSFVSGK